MYHLGAPAADQSVAATQPCATTTVDFRAAPRTIKRAIAGLPTVPFRYLGCRIRQISCLDALGGRAYLIYTLIGFRNRVFVMLQWTWAYLTRQRTARLITNGQRTRERFDELVASGGRAEARRV